jgi:S1-C subfamily serine protease
MSHIAADSHAPMGRPSRMGARLAPGMLLVVASLWCSTPARAQGLDKAVRDRVKDATVYVKNKVSGQLHSIGSGFAIKVTGDTVLVMTNKHVVAGEDDDERPAGAAKPDIFVVFRSGTPQEQEVPAKLLTFDHRDLLDLALLEVKGVRQPPQQPISVERPVPESELFETMTTYCLGFPFIDVVTAKDVNVNPSVTVNPLTITSFPRSASGRLERIKFSGSVIQGNSGGPVVNDKGALVGVIVARIGGENVGYAIPPNVIASFLAGDVDVLFGLVASWTGKVAKIRFGGRMVDPFSKIRSMSLRYAKQSTVPSPLKPDMQGRYPLLANSTVVPMKLVPASAIKDMPIADAAGVAEFDMTVNNSDERKILFQVVVTDSFGRNFGGEPVPVVVPDRPGNFKEVVDYVKPKTPSQWSCLVNLDDRIKMKHDPGMTTISLPGDVPHNNMPKQNLFNAPCALVKVEGDFVAAVEVLNSFDPGGEGAMMPNGRKYPTSFQSTGLLIWQDEKNFVRLERSKGSDGQIGMVNQVLVEVYKNGKPVAVDYIDVPLAPIALVAIRKGGSIQLLFAMPPQKLSVFHEMAVDFDNEVLVGVAAANLSKRPFQAKLKGFHLTTLNGGEIAAKPVKMTKLVDSGIERLSDGTLIFEGAKLRVAKPENAPVSKQDMAKTDKGVWSGDQQLLWSNEKKTSTLTLELPVETAGKYEIKARFTQAPDYAIAKVAIDGQPLYKDGTIDLYAQEVQPSKLYSLGTFPLGQGKRKLTITIFNKNLKSSGYHFGLDDVQLVPAK